MNLSDFLTAIDSNLSVDGQGLCHVEINGHLLSFSETSDGLGFMIYAKVGAIPEKKSKLYAELLAGNLYGLGTLNAVLSIDEASGSVVLHRSFPSGALEEAEATTLLEEFISALSSWKEKL